MTSIPENTNELTPEWFTSILKLPRNQKVNSVRLQALGEKDSVSGYIYRATLTYTQKTSTSLIVKLPKPPNQRSPFLLKAYIREVRFYEKLAPNVGIHVPKLIHAEVDIETSDYILVLEDFPESTNVRNETGATLDQAYKLLKNMAKLHATHWNDPSLSDYKFLISLEDSFNMYITGLPNSVPVFLSRFSKYLEADVIGVIEKLPDVFEDVVTPLHGSPQTLIHNDYAMKNILILEDSEDVSFVLVDWANVGQGPCVKDLSFFIGTSIPTELRAEHESTFLRYYLESLRGMGVSGYSYARLFDDYHRALVIDLARVVHFGGREYFSSMYESIIRQDIGRRTGSIKELDLSALI